MLDNGYIHPKAEHTKPAGIWRKLESLYQLDSLDERENARQLEKVEIPEEYKGSQDGSERRLSIKSLGRPRSCRCSSRYGVGHRSAQCTVVGSS